MKSFSFLLALLVMSVMFVACKSDVGPEGPKGPRGETGAAGAAGAKGDKGVKGDAGAAGADGNTDVLILNDAGRTIDAGIGAKNSWAIGYDVISRAKAEASAIYVYLKLPREPEEWVSIPGSVFFPGGSHQTFGMATRFTNTAVQINVIRSAGAEALAYSAVKFIFVPGSATARQAAVDYTDYNAVKEYYNLAD